MKLTDEQRQYAEQAMAVVPKAIHAFCCRYPSLRIQVRQIDSAGVAYLAVCRAARTYDPSKSQVTTYFSMAVRNALLKEIDRNRRARYDSPQRVPLELAEAVACMSQPLSVRLQVAIARLPSRYRKIVNMRFYRGLSLREIGDSVRCDPRTVRRRIDAALAVLRTLMESDVSIP